MILGRQLIESYEENEKLFSTGNDELDDILEEVYYSGIEDGYDYAQKEFVNINGAKNKLKSIPRHLRRSINQAAGGRKIATWADKLSPEEVKAIAVTYRTANTPGTKTSKRMKRLIKKGKMTAQKLEHEAEVWGEMHKQGKGAEKATALFQPGYYSPEEAAEVRQIHKNIFGY